MRTKNVLVILMTILVFLSAVLLGVSSVYRIDEVFVCASTVSMDAKTEADELRKRLLEVYQKQSTLFASDEEAKSVVAQFPYFRLTAVEKGYPNRLIVRVSEDEEVFAMPCDETESFYYILGLNGVVLGIRENYNNRSDETGVAKNVLIKGLSVTGEKGQLVIGDERLSYVLAFCQKTSALLNGIRKNIVSVTVSGASAEQTVTLKLTTYEGVNIYIRNPSVATEEKAEVAVNAYLSMSDGDRTKGMLTVFDGENGIQTTYLSKDSLNAF